MVAVNLLWVPALSFSHNAGMTYAGLNPDFRVLVRRGRKEAQKYWLQYKEEIPVAMLVREVAAVAQEFTQSGSVLPCCRSHSLSAVCGRSVCRCWWPGSTVRGRPSIRSTRPAPSGPGRLLQSAATQTTQRPSWRNGACAACLLPARVNE